MPARRRRVRGVLLVAAVLLALGVGVAAATRFAGPLPPRRLVMSTGREDGAYHRAALEYRRLLAAQGFTLDVHPGPGSVATLERLAAGEVDVGFVQGGIATTTSAPTLTTLGSVFYEPLWVFCRKGTRITYLSDLRGRTLAVGEVGSGTRALVLRLLADSGVTNSTARLVDLPSAAAATALVRGDIDAAFFVVAPRSDLVNRLLSSPDVELATERRHLAYAGHYPFLTTLRIGEGMLDMARNIPGEDKVLLGAAATLVVRDGIHPDLVRLLMGAAQRVHGHGGLLERAGQFPSDANVELPVHEQARRYFRTGPSWLERTFPFWLAGLLDRTVLVVLPAATLLAPLFGLVLPALDRRWRARIARQYVVLRACDRCDETQAETLDGDIDRLRQLRREVERTEVPLLFLPELVDLSRHIDLLLEHLERRRASLATRDGRPCPAVRTVSRS